MKEINRFITEPQKNLPITEEVNVLIAGGGVTGVMAAVAAARAGASTLLVEARAHLGAVATMGLPLQGFCDRSGSQIVGGLAEEFRQRLIAIGGASDFISCHMHNPFVVVDPECVKLVCQQMIEEAGVKLLLHTPVTAAIRGSKGIEVAIIEGKSGREALKAEIHVDCTGDADLAVRAGASCDMVSKEQLQASTLNMILGGVDTENIKQYIAEDPERYKLYHLLDRETLMNNQHFVLVGLQEFAKKAQNEHPEWEHLWDVVCYITLISKGTVCINSVHMDSLCGCETRDLTQIEMMGRRRAQHTLAFYREYIPGFENASLISTGPWAGIRETRILKGRERLTIDAICEGCIPDDTVALGGYPVDIHDPDTNHLVFYHVPRYGIPYGCMLTEDVGNLLVAGRAISATHEAMASSRVMAQCMAEGQAAGQAAAMAVRDGILPGDLDVRRLRAALAEKGQIL